MTNNLLESFSLNIVDGTIMQLKPVDKQRYQTRSRYCYFGISTVLIILSLVWSSCWIYLFSKNDDNFIFNLLGVVSAVVSMFPIVRYCKNQPWFDEVVYIWNLKQELNKINRKMSSLVQACDRAELNAFTAIKFSYQGSRQIWQLDDNTLMLTELNLSEQQLDEAIAKQGLVININDYHSEILKAY